MTGRNRWAVESAHTGRLLCLGGAAFGALGLAGWLLGADLMTRLIAGRPAMMPTSALGLIALGLSAGLARYKSEHRRLIAGAADVLALCALSVGLVTAMEYALGRDLGIERLLVPVAATPVPGRPSPITAAALILLGAAQLMSHRRHGRLARAAAGLTAAAALLAFVSLVGHMYGADETYELQSALVIGVALPTALALLLISAGMLAQDSRVDFLSLLLSPRPAGVLVRRLGLVAIVGTPVFGVLAYRAMLLMGVVDVPLTLAVLTIVGIPLVAALILVTGRELDRTYTALDVSREQARTLIEESADGIFVADLDGRYTDVNAAGCRMLGLSREDVVGRTIVDFIPPEETGRLVEARDQLLQGGSQTAEWHLRRADGAYVPVEVSATILADGRWQGIARDISRRKAAEEAARRSEARLEGIISLAADAIISVDEDQRIVMFNAGAQRIFGWAPEEVMGRPLDLLIPARLSEKHREHIGRFQRERVSGRTMSDRSAVAGIRRNGQEFPAEAAISKLHQDGHTIFTVILRDTTTAHELRDDLRRSVERFRVLADAGEALNSSIAAGDFAARVAERVAVLATGCIAECCAIELQAPERLIFLRCAGGARRDDLEPFLVAMLELGEPLLVDEAGQEWFRTLASDHPVRALATESRTSLIVVPIRAGEQLLGAMMLLSGEGRRYKEADLQLAIDLARRTALVLENRRLYQAAETATRARDEILSIVAHDLRSPLATVQFRADVLSNRVSGDRRESTRSEVEVIQRAIRRATRLVDDLLDVARIEAGTLGVVWKEVPPESIVRGVVESLAPAAASASVRLETEVARGLSSVVADEDRIHQVLANLVDNAIRFTPAGGCVRIIVSPDGDDVRFAVADSGRGIPAEYLSRLFDRFWQAAGQRRGAGLGLAIAKGIVETHGGRIWVESVPGQGSTFTFTLRSTHAISADPEVCSRG